MTIFSNVEETNQESEIANISVAPSETKDEILPAIPTDGKMIFPGDHMSLSKILLKDAKKL